MIILKNRGEIDIDVIKTMGVNVKESESAIGYFGTGLKYAIAVFLREGIDLQLWIGSNHYQFHCEPKVIRGKEFNLCKMTGPFDSVDLGFTTDLGKNWEVWQAYREIHSNCLDESGEIYRAGSARGESGFTTFAIADIETDGIFLNQSERECLFSSRFLEIYEGGGEWIYYRGIRAKRLDKESLFTYNIKQECQLTEDRLLCYDWDVQYSINNEVATMSNEDVIKAIVTAPIDKYESSLGMRHWTRNAPAAPFLKVVADNSKSVNSSVREFTKMHTPPAPKTRKEKHADLLSQLNDFCDSFGLEYEIDGDQITITGDLIQEHD